MTVDNLSREHSRTTPSGLWLGLDSVPATQDHHICSEKLQVTSIRGTVRKHQGRQLQGPKSRQEMTTTLQRIQGRRGAAQERVDAQDRSVYSQHRGQGTAAVSHGSGTTAGRTGALSSGKVLLGCSSPALLLAREGRANSNEASLSETRGAHEDSLAGRRQHVH